MAARNPDPEFWSGRRVLVTGHTGFKGAWLSVWLARLGAQVTGFALAPETEPSLYTLALADQVDSRMGDVRDLAALSACVADTQPEVVLHLAAQALVRPSYSDPVGTYASNVMGTVHLLEAVRACPSVRAVVIVTSDKAYENREWVWAYREDEPMGGRDPYSNSKGCAELVTSAYRASFFGSAGHPARIASARAGNVIGGGDWSMDRLIPDMVRAFGRGEPVQIRSPGAVRPWQHVLEPLSGYLRLAEVLCEQDGTRYAEGWNFGPADEDCRPVSEVVARLAQGWGEGVRWQLASGIHPHEATFLKVDASKARAHLGWDRRLRLAEALDWTGMWYRAQAQGADASELTRDQIARYEALAETEDKV
ncbi:CDP-glucose 4,6-dehydratase [Methylobacterium radiotolerans]|uniref:CDP-glucose 4,6-dehydratase n=1 Tax=Methylobacterium radiotolerans TaxID=31998 RepID=UPI0009772855|nr:MULTISPECIES: CDP-glucose 4,6-dehydratase [Methylobacterium]MDE3749492.1 CDP-glucose 4,6-dehydratase [Methylobacterium radiotolerans]ONF48373.1 CDP-glucose 4,6-dehydratase [Methylobacterium radiotolerans]PVY94268.1 CDP-glucose 4,6-dehydratase [Methylobacterium organophilum]